MRSLPAFAARAAALALAAGVGGAAAACPTPVKVTASDAQPSDFAFVSLSLSTTPLGPTLMAGAANDDTAAGANTGSVYTFARANGTWSQIGHFDADDAQPGDLFGISVAFDEFYAVVGATGVGDSGAAYFFQRLGTDWVQVAKVFPAGNESGADVGRSVAIRGTEAIIGAPLRDQIRNNITFTNAGAAYIYRRINGTWTHIYTLSEPFDNVEGDRLGAAVAIGGEFAVAGAPYGENVNWPQDMGYLHVHRSDGGAWDYQRRIINPWAQQGDHYGASVATDGTFIVAGAPDDDLEPDEHPIAAARTDSGCVLIHRWDAAEEAWHLEARLFAPDPINGAHFGSSVAIRNGRVVVAAAGVKRVYVFRRIGVGQWVQEAVLTDGDAEAGGNFGSSIAFDGTWVAAGDPGDDRTGLSNAGAAYLFDQPGFGQGGDLCTAPTPISGAGEYTGCTGLATLNGATTCGGFQVLQGPDVWYSWTPTCSGNAIIDTFGSEFDTVLSIHSACPTGGATNTLSCNDDAGGILGNTSLITFDYTAGTTYLIRIAGYAGARGNYTLRVWEGVAPSNDNCATPQQITNGLYTFHTCLATPDGPAVNGCNGTTFLAGSDVWFRYTAPCTGTVTLDLCNSNFDTVVAVYPGAGCPGPGTAIACNDDTSACGPGSRASRLTFPTVQGTQYTIRVAGFSVWHSGTGVMNVYCSTACPADWDGNGVVNSSDISAFLTSWLQSVQASNLTADFNHDQATNSSDISAFLTAWLQAVQNGC